MTKPHITLEFDEHEGLYWPGDVISGVYLVESDRPEEIKAIEVSILWHTLGKGDEDFGVHFFQRETDNDAGPLLSNEPRRFATELPNSPLSYDGLIVKIRWCVRIRAFRTSGRDLLAEQPFRLGLMARPAVDVQDPPKASGELESP